MFSTSIQNDPVLCTHVHLLADSRNVLITNLVPPRGGSPAKFPLHYPHGEGGRGEGEEVGYNIDRCITIWLQDIHIWWTKFNGSTNGILYLQYGLYNYVANVVVSTAWANTSRSTYLSDCSYHFLYSLD